MNTNSIIATILKISPQRASLVEGYLRLEYGTLDRLSRLDIRRAYRTIGPTIDADVSAAIKLADSFGCLVVLPPAQNVKGEVADKK